MKKLTVTLMILSLIVVASCGKDKKKSNNNLVLSGVINPQTGQPQVTSGQAMDPNMQQQIMQQFNTYRQSNPQLIQQKMMTGQPIYFSAQLIQNPYGVNGYQQPYGQQPYGQQPYGQPYGYPNPYQNPYQQPYQGQVYPQTAGAGLYQLAGAVSFY
jgi:hypothetical protein